MLLWMISQIALDLLISMMKLVFFLGVVFFDCCIVGVTRKRKLDGGIGVMLSMKMFVVGGVGVVVFGGGGACWWW